MAEGTVRGTGSVRVADYDCSTDVPRLYAADDTATRELICGGFTGGGSHNAAWAASSGSWAGQGAAAFAMRRRRSGAGLRPVGGAGVRPTGAARTTRAVTIDAPITDVWPWLAQIGEDRGGFYSYSLLERVAGAHIRNADTIHPEWQDVRVGDTVWLARQYGDSARMMVAAVKPNSHLLLMSPDDFARVQRGEKASGAWGFYLREQGGWTRLVIRGSGGVVGHVAFDVLHFVMEQKMMRGIQHRAEQVRREQLNAHVRREYQRVREPIGLVK